MLGKFLPLHKGHVHLLETAQEACKRLTIVVCSLSSEPIDGNLRFRWVQEAFPDCRVVHLADDSIPQEPQDHPGFWQIWRKALKGIHPEPLDLIFSSEVYGDRLAQELGAQHRLVDLKRSAYPISGTLIRQNPMAHWDMIPDHVRGHFAKRVLITGSESCGKSTLTAQLAEHFGTVGVQEYAREYLKNMDFVMEDLDQIAFRQYQLQQEALSKANKVCFSDTGAIETAVYAQHYLGRTSPLIDRYVALQKDNYDLVLLLSPEVTWVPDGMRNLDNVRWEMHKKYVDLLERLDMRYTVVGGPDYRGRTDAAIRAVEQLIGVKP